MITTLEIKTSMLFNVDFANNGMIFCFFFFFLMITLYILIPVTVAQIFNPTEELVIPIGILRNGNQSSNCRSKNKRLFGII